MVKNLPPPSNDTDFENLCLDLWKKLWNDPQAKKYGRKGQGQSGIDIIGHPNQGTERYAVQCKVRTKGRLSTTDITDDFKAAKTLKLPIKELIFATTAPRDVETQDFIDELSLTSQNEGGFSVCLWSWDDIQEEIPKHLEVFHAHYREYFDTFRYEFQACIDQINASEPIEHYRSVIFRPLIDGIQQIREKHLEEEAVRNEDATVRSVQEVFLDKIRDDLNAAHITSVFEQLNQYEKSFLETSNKNEKFRYYYYLGDAFNEVNDQEKCAEYFSQAYNIDPDHKIANKLKALALLIEGNKVEAAEYAQKTIEADPCDEIAYQVIVQAYPNRSVEEIIATIPEDQKGETAVAFTISEVYRRKGELVQSLEWLERAFSSSNDSFKIKIHFAQALFEVAFKQCTLSYFGRKNLDSETKIRRAIELLDSAYVTIKADKKLYQSKAYLLVNQANAYRFLGEYTLAEKTFDEYFELVTPDDEAIRLRALLAIETDNFTMAESLLKTITNKEIYAETTIMLAETLKLQNKYEEAIAILDEGTPGNDDIITEESQRLRIYILLEQKAFLEALDFIDQLLVEKITITRLLDKSRVLKALGREQEAIGLIKEAEKLVTDATSVKEKFDLGVHCYDLKRYNKAAYFFSQVDTVHSDSFLTQRLVYSYYLSGQENKAIEICKQLREEYGIIRFAADLEGQLYQYIGDFNQALEVYEQMLLVDPNKFEIKLRKALIWFLQDDFAKVDQFLRNTNIPIDKSVPLDVGLNYVYLLKERDEIGRALSALYDLRRAHFNNHQAHLKYIGLFFEHEDSITQIEKCTNTSVVTVNTAVSLKNLDGKNDWLIIENNPDADIRCKELYKENKLAKELLGKKVAETLPDGRVVESIITKYNYAYQESMDRYNEYFPDSNAFKKVEMPEIKEEASPLDILRPLLDMVDAQDLYRQKLEKVYTNSPITVGCLAKARGINPIEVWAGLLGNSNIQLASNTGTDRERVEALSYLQSKDLILVLDVIALLTIHELGIADKIKATYSHLVVSWSTIQVIYQYLLDCKTYSKRGYLTIRKEGDSYVKYQIEPEYLQRQCDFLNNLYLWAKKNCDVQPVNELLNINRFEREKLRSTFESSFFDSMLLATRASHLFFTDDIRLRAFAVAKYQVKGVWTQTFIFDLYNKGLISDSEYADYVLRLVELGYNYVSINWNPMLESYKRAGWKCEGLFVKVIDIVLSTKTTLDSSVLVLTNFYLGLWKEDVSIEIKERALKYTLDKMLYETKNINKDNLVTAWNRIFREGNLSLSDSTKIEDIVLQLIRRLIGARFSQIDFTRIQVLNLFDEWHLLKSQGKGELTLSAKTS